MIFQCKVCFFERTNFTDSIKASTSSSVVPYRAVNLLHFAVSLRSPLIERKLSSFLTISWKVWNWLSRTPPTHIPVHRLLVFPRNLPYWKYYNVPPSSRFQTELLYLFARRPQFCLIIQLKVPIHSRFTHIKPPGRVLHFWLPPR